MPITDSQITFTEVGGTTSITLDVYIMPVDHVDAIARDLNGLTYQRDVAVAAFIQEVEISIHRCAITRANLDQIWIWMTNATLLTLHHVADDVPIADYEGRMARIQRDIFHHALIGTGPFSFFFKPDSAARP